MQKAIETSSDHFRPNTCPGCRRAIIWAKLGTKLIPVETCAVGVGNIGLSWGLFAKADEPPTAEIVTTRTRYRSHRGRCADEERRRRQLAAPFSGESFTRKKQGP